MKHPGFRFAASSKLPSTVRAEQQRWRPSTFRRAHLADSGHRRRAGRTAVASRCAAGWRRRWTTPAGRPRRSCTPSRICSYDSAKFRMGGLVPCRCTPPETGRGKAAVLQQIKNHRDNTKWGFYPFWSCLLASWHQWKWRQMFTLF